MDSNNPSIPSTSSAESLAVTDENQMVVSAMDTISLQQVQPVTTATIPTPILPPIAPIPTVPPSIPRPLAPLPPRPPLVKPPMGQNDGSRTSDSDSNHDDSRWSCPGESSQEYEISEESRLVRERQEKAVQELMMKHHAAALAVPTNDGAVRIHLRQLGEPLTLFGEREMERCERLRVIMARLDSEGQLEMLMKAHEDEETTSMGALAEPEEDIQYPFYTEGSRELLEARKEIAKYSIVKAALRLHRARRKKEDPDEDLDSEIDWTLK